MSENLRELLKIPSARLDEINALLLNPDTQVMNDFLAVVEKYGTPQEINAKARPGRPASRFARKSKSCKARIP